MGILYQWPSVNCQYWNRNPSFVVVWVERDRVPFVEPWAAYWMSLACAVGISSVGLDRLEYNCLDRRLNAITAAQAIRDLQADKTDVANISKPLKIANT